MAVHIGAKIKQVAKQKGMKVTELAKRINTTRENIYSIFKRRTIDTGLLDKFCRSLDHDFYQYFSTAYLEENKNLKEEVARLKEDNALLKHMIELLKEKSDKKRNQKN